MKTINLISGIQIFPLIVTSSTNIRDRKHVISFLKFVVITDIKIIIDRDNRLLHVITNICNHPHVHPLFNEFCVPPEFKFCEISEQVIHNIIHYMQIINIDACYIEKESFHHYIDFQDDEIDRNNIINQKSNSFNQNHKNGECNDRFNSKKAA